MSLDVYLLGPEKNEKCMCSNCHNEHTYKNQEEFFSNNITHNLGKMASEAGIYQALWRPEELGITHAKQLIDPLSEGLKKLLDDPLKFENLNPENGWGSYSGLVNFVIHYLDACKEYPEALINVSR